MKDLKERKQQLLKNLDGLIKNLKRLPPRKREMAITKIRARLAEVNYLMK